MSEKIKRDTQSLDNQEQSLSQTEKIAKFNINDRIRFKSRVGNREPSVNGKEAQITHLPSGKGSVGHLYYIKFDNGVEIGAREEELEAIDQTTTQ